MKHRHFSCLPVSPSHHFLERNYQTCCCAGGENKTSARLLPLESLARGCSGSRRESRSTILSLKVNGQRADSVHLAEKLCSFYHLDIQRHSRKRAGKGDRGGSAVGAKYIVRGRKDTTQTVLNIERAQGCCPWSPPQEGARGQKSMINDVLKNSSSTALQYLYNIYKRQVFKPFSK